MAAKLLWLNWISWFNGTFQFGPKSFYGMASYSFDYIKWAIAQVNSHVTVSELGQAALIRQHGKTK
jgi:hypothetical protein